MKYKNLAVTLGVAVLTTIILFVSCKKINDFTPVGDDLIPDVDNINTFDTILDIQAFNDTFSLLTDTTVSTAATTQWIGHISDDPLFGKTDAGMAFQLKPPSFRFTFGARPDSLHLDSVVLVLSFVETYGDSNAVQTVNVFEVGNPFTADSAYNIRINGQTKAGLLGSRSFQPRVLNDSVKVFRDTTANQLRIRLDDAFGQRLLNFDTTSAGGRIPAFVSDSAFDSYFHGFTMESTSGNAIVGIDLLGANTKLAIYYKNDHGDAGSVPTANWDTTVTYWTFSGNPNSASAQHISRDFSGTQLAALSNGSTGTPDNEVYIQSTPGSFATLKIPGLNGLSNRVVYRAEIIAEQIYSSIFDSIFFPTFLYLDAFDPTIPSFITVPFDVTFDANGSPNLGALGVAPFNIADPSGRSIKQWRLNVTRYVQNVVNKNITTPFDLRLSMPFTVREKFRSTPGATPFSTIIPVNAAPGKGRVRLHGTGDGSVPGADPQRLRMRIVYSKI
ncbi:MAG: DUF4270 family protein [Chitinophagaceae bacterium]